MWADTGWVAGIVGAIAQIPVTLDNAMLVNKTDAIRRLAKVMIAPFLCCQKLVRE